MNNENHKEGQLPETFAAATEALFKMPSLLKPKFQAEARVHLEHSYRENDSEGHIPALLDSPLPPDAFYAVLGKLWTDSDFIGRHQIELEPRLSKASRRQLNLMMNDEELDSWHDLPSTIIAYRFAYDFNRQGFSYSLSRSVSLHFSTIPRYTHHGPEGRFLIKAAIRREHAVIKLERDELEIVTARPHEAKTLEVTKLAPAFSESQ